MSNDEKGENNGDLHVVLLFECHASHLVPQRLPCSSKSYRVR